ncbi:MAG: 4-hydroxy-tetrahydrodipicolinate reductase [Rikenellaceae bacterium]|nr:4-hydroxy-tetrahydrodipicolinate reductase [Rikenellaceae bacterium]
MRVAIIGYGKMGHIIESILKERGHDVALIIDIDNASDLCAEKCADIDVAIEFSAPDAAFANVRKCLEMGLPVVCGTTAWGERMAEAKELCEANNGAFFYSSNYSVGVNVMFALSRKLAQIMNTIGGYKVSMEETHHIHKKDAPSGTAITLAEGILSEIPTIKNWTLIEGEGSVAEDSLPIVSFREGEVPGIHTVRYESDADVITLTHDAKSRAGFALGAVLAAEFIVGKKGCFTMSDLFKFE